MKIKRMNKALTRFVVVACLSIALLQTVRSEVFLDNTANRSQPLSSNGATISTGYGSPLYGLVFQVGNGANVLLTNIVAALTDPVANGQYNIQLSLYNVDAQNNPVGSPIVTSSTEFTIGAPIYLRFPLTSPSWNLSAGEMYMVTLSSDSVEPSLLWVTPSPAQPPTSSPWATFGEYRSTTPSGPSWTDSSVFGAIQMSGTVTAVPEPATWAMVALGIGTLLGSRRLRRRSS
jgi:hypothetical protein